MAFIENQLPIFQNTPTENIFRYTPSKSSPLSPRSHNMNRTSFSSPQAAKIDFFPLSPPSSPPTPKVNSKSAKRKFRPNPLMQTPEDARERRRNLFLKKLQTNREEKILQARGGEDEMMRLVFLSEQRRWENMHERAAPIFSTPDDEEAEILALQEESYDAILAEQMLAIEDQELEALIESSHNPSIYEDNEMSDAPSAEQINPQSVCMCCGRDELVPMLQEMVCFNCGWSFPI